MYAIKYSTLNCARDRLGLAMRGQFLFFVEGLTVTLIYEEQQRKRSSFGFFFHVHVVKM